MRPMIRWKAAVPLSLLLGGMVLVWLFMVDHWVERGLESAGTFLLGARVDLASADVKLSGASVTLRGLEVTDPRQPMKNLFEADEIVADLMILPLLEKKVVVETLAVRGLRFGTDRETSGAAERASPASGRIGREVREWASGVTVPQFSLGGLAGTVGTDALRAESLRTYSEARALVERADSAGREWRMRLAALNPGPRIDSARSLVSQLRNAQPLRLGPAGVVRLVRSARANVTAVSRLRTELAALDTAARNGIEDLQRQVRGLSNLRAQDYAYARGLLQLPSLEAPDISPALFGRAAVRWMEPVIYWMRFVEENLPQGIRPRKREGPERTRLAGTTVLFPRERSYPAFLLQHADLDLAIGGEGAAAGEYSAQLDGVSSSPALYGRPIRLTARRARAARGPRDLSVTAVLDHVTDEIRDSIDVTVSEFDLPALDLDPIGARLTLGRGDVSLSLVRSRDRLRGRWLWRSDKVRWQRTGAGSGNREMGSGAAPTPQVGSREWAEDLLWRSVSGMRQVEIDIGIDGSVTEPRLSVTSNVGDVVAQSLRREVGREVARAEQRVRSQVDRLANRQIAQVQTRIAALASGILTEVPLQLNLVEQLQEELERELENLQNRLPPGLRIPSLSSLLGRLDLLARGSAAGSPLEQRHVVALVLADVDLARPRDALLLVHQHLLPLREPSGRTADGEQHREHLDRELERLVDDPRVEIDVGV